MNGSYYLMFNGTGNMMCCCSSNGRYRGEQDKAGQVVPVKGHTRVERMTGLRGYCTWLAS